MLELCKIPGQNKKLLKILEPQINNDPPCTSKIVVLEKPKAPKKVTFSNTIEQPPSS